MLSHFVSPEERMTVLSEPNIRVISQRLLWRFVLTPSQGAVRHLHVLGCKLPLPAPSLPHLWNVFMVWSDAFGLGAPFNLFSQGKYPCTFANSCLYAWVWRSPLALVCSVSLLPLEHSCMMLETDYHSLIHFRTQCFTVSS